MERRNESKHGSSIISKPVSNQRRGGAGCRLRVNVNLWRNLLKQRIPRCFPYYTLIDEFYQFLFAGHYNYLYFKNTFLNPCTPLSSSKTNFPKLCRIHLHRYRSQKNVTTSIPLYKNIRALCAEAYTRTAILLKLNEKGKSTLYRSEARVFC